MRCRGDHVGHGGHGGRGEHGSPSHCGQDRTRQDRHLNSTFQVAYDRQLLQFLRYLLLMILIFSLEKFSHLNADDLTVSTCFFLSRFSI